MSNLDYKLRSVNLNHKNVELSPDTFKKILEYVRDAGTVTYWENPKEHNRLKEKYKKMRKDLGISKEEIDAFSAQNPSYISDFSEGELDAMKRLEVLRVKKFA